VLGPDADERGGFGEQRELDGRGAARALGATFGHGFAGSVSRAGLEYQRKVSWGMGLAGFLIHY
jgi:hypothetical protein